jgi:DNA-binding response OmpR family regulator
MLILIVEPDWWVAALLADELAAAGHQVAGLAPSVEAALALAEGVVPEVAVVARDLGRVGEGVETAQFLRERHGCPVILTADKLDEDDAMRAAAPVAVVPRGGRSRELLAALERVRALMAPRGPMLFDGVPAVPPADGAAEEEV